jgi:transcriptional regulator of acetoin/glycerol metabolism
MTNGVLEIHGSMAKAAELLKIDRSTIFLNLRRDDSD